MRKKTTFNLFTIIFLSLFLVGQNFASNNEESKKNIGKFTTLSENGNRMDVQGVSTAILSGAHIGQKIGGAVNPYTGSNQDLWAGTISGSLDGTNTDFYCIDINHHLATGTSNPYTDEGPTQTKITYILNNYYPFVSLPYNGALSTENKEASAVQTAIWHFADGLDESTIGDTEVKNRVMEIIADANANAAAAATPDYFSITPANQTLYEGETGNFSITALDTDGNPFAGLVIDLATTSGTLSTNQVTTDANGNATFSIVQSGANFATITAQAHATIQHGTQYFHVELPEEKQKLVLATPTIASSSASAEINWIPQDVTLGDFVWHDKNVNGIQDNGEEGIENVTVELYDDAGNLLSTTTTNALGYYKFTQLANGNYKVKVADSNFDAGGVFEGADNEKWYITYADKGNDDAVDSDGDENNSSEVTIANNDDDFTIDFGYFKTCVTLEKTAEQTVDAGDVINYNFTVTNCGDIVLHGGASVYDPMINPSGDHKLANNVVYPGTSWSFTRSYPTTEANCGTLVNDAWVIGHPQMPDGSYKEDIRYNDSWSVEVVCNQKASIGDRVWFDENQDGIQDFGEDGVENVTVNLYTCTDDFVATAQTDADGYYLFEDLEIGSYYVQFVLPNGYLFSPQNAGNDSAVDSDADETSGKTICTDLSEGEVDLTWDAGIYTEPDDNFDLSIEKTASNTNPQDEELVTYTITVTNNGTVDGTNIEVTDVLPSGLDYQSSTPAGYDATTGIWTVGDLAAGASKSLNITVKVDYLSMSQAPIFDLGIAAPYNLFVLRDVNQPTGSDTEGKVAVGRNAVFGNYSVGDKLPLSGGTEDVLLVGRKLTYTSGQVYSGNVVYGKYLDVQQINLCSDGSIRKENNPFPIDFAQARTDLRALSSQLATRPVTGTTTFEWGGLTLNGDEPILNVFNVDGNDLSAANSVEINVPNGSVVVVNVNRRNVTWTGGLVVNGTSIGNVIYNFHKARTLTIQGIDIRGSVLAPKAKVNFVSGVINGQMICNFYEGQGQMNNSLFVGSIQGNPEITNCAEITAVDQIEDNTDNNISCAEIVVDVDLNPNNGNNGSNDNEWVEFANAGMSEMIWSMYQSTNGLLVGTVGGNIYLNQGTDFVLLNDGMDATYIWSLYEFNGNIYAGTEVGLFKYDGTDWTKVAIDGDVRSITSLDDVLYAAVWGGGVFASSDEGANWTAINTGLEMSGYAVHTLTVADGTLFTGTFGLGILKYDFANAEWVELNAGYQFIWSLATDANGTIYAGTYGGGALASVDNGETWNSINDGLPNMYVYSVSTYGNDVYISTWAAGVYKFDTNDLSKTKGSASVASIPITGKWKSIGMAGIEVSSVMVDETTQTLYAGTSNGTIYKMVDGTTDVNENGIAPTKFALEQNYPNPFNPSTKIEFAIPKAGIYSVKVFNILGQEVSTLVSKDFAPGNYTFNFDASNLTSGIYFYKLIGENVNLTKKMMLLK